MSSYVIAAPEAPTVASGNVTGVGEAIRGAAAAAAPSTTGIVAAAGDEVSAAISNLFGRYAHEFQSLTAQATLFHSQFERAVSAAAGAYAAAEAANASVVQTFEQQAESPGVFSPVERLLGHRSFSTGGTGTAGTDAAQVAATPGGAATVTNTAPVAGGVSPRSAMG
jgi:PE family